MPRETWATMERPGFPPPPRRWGWERMGAFWVALLAMLGLEAAYLLTCFWTVYLDAEVRSQPFEWHEVWLRFADGNVENFLSEFGITAFLLVYIDRRYPRLRRYAASDEE